MAHDDTHFDDLFCRAIEIAAPEERAAFITSACGPDEGLRLRVVRLVDAHFLAGSFLEASPASPTLSMDTVTPSEGIGTVIGPYKLIQQLGEGGMGTVFMAEQTSPVHRKVALKVIKPGMDTAQVVARFEAERQALALMDHPNIAKVLDAGATAVGRPYFVMELVKGVPITEYCDAVQLTPRERLELFLPVCAAVQHAHQKGIIHRDIKPSNVLVAMLDDKPVPKVIDFGIAKAIEQRLTERSLFTQHGAIVGTLEYMSPEQAEMSAMGIDTRTDVYALGVMLYELLTGTTPLESARLRESGYAEILKRIREEEPPKPSTRLSESLPSVAARRKTEPARLTKLVRGDLDWIVMKSIEKDRVRRYETADGLARDIGRYLEGDAVEACPPSARYKLSKFASKHRAALVTAAAFVLLLVAASVISVGLALRADRQRARAVTAEAAAKVQQERAQEREQLAIDSVKRFSDVIRETPELKNNPSLARLRATLLKEPQAFFKTLRNRLQTDRETSPDSLYRLARASFQLGILSREIGGRQDALAALEESLAIQERLASEDPASFEVQHILSENYDNVGTVNEEMGRVAEGLALHERATKILEQLARREPSNAHIQDDLAKNHSLIALLHHQNGRREEALASYAKSHAIRERLARDFPSNAAFQALLADSHITAGLFQSELGQQAKVLVSHELALAIYERLTKEHPTELDYQRDLALCLHNIGNAQHAAGNLTGALTTMERARTIGNRLIREAPSVSGYQNSLAECKYGLGVVQMGLGRAAEALASHEQALAIYERLAKDDPSTIDHQIHLASTYNSLGVQQSRLNRPAESLALYERARAIQERLIREAPSISNLQDELARTYLNIGNLHGQADRGANALDAYERALPIRQRLAKDHPESPSYASGVGEILSNLIRAYEGLGRIDKAADARRELAKLEADDPAKAALDKRLAAVLKGRAADNDVERLQLASRAYEKELYVSATRLCAEALAHNPKLGDDREAQHRYNAACAAAKAGSGRGNDDPPPDDAAKTKLRRQALDWLRAELSAWERMAMTVEPGNKAEVARTLRHWKNDADLAGLRDAEQLVRRSEDEREMARRLWSDVDAQLTKTGGL